MTIKKVIERLNSLELLPTAKPISNKEAAGIRGGNTKPPAQNDGDPDEYAN